MKRSLFISKEVPEPLETRAWCLQERLLSSRVLKFETSQLAWDCVSAKINANGPMPSPSDLSRRARLDWTHIVQDFTGRNLTYASDKLAALSGYAKHVNSLTGDTYLAGFWKKDIMRHLLWWIDIRSTTLESRPATYRAPSWSWASTDHQCHFMNFNSQSSPLSDNIQLLDASSPTFTTDPFGQVDPSQRGYLKFKGSLSSRIRSEAFYKFESMGTDRYVTLHSSQHTEPDSPEVIGSIYPDSWSEIETDAKANTPISILRITEHYGLLLSPATWPEFAFEEKLFCRIGLLEMRGEEKGAFDGDSEIGVVVVI